MLRPSGSASFGLARFLRRKGQLDRALDAVRDGLAVHPESRKLRGLQLVMLLQSGRHGEAEAILNDYLSEEMGEVPRPDAGSVEPETSA